MSHTPGPWNWTTEDIGDEDFVIVPAEVFAGKIKIVSWDGGLYAWDEGPKSIDEIKANARLIAAAPTLLEACEAVLEAHAKYSPSDMDSEDAYCHAIGRLNEIVNQAKGIS